MVIKMLKREIEEKLMKWKTQKNRKALCIFGARQIGKTTTIREFGKKIMNVFVKSIFMKHLEP